jgi:hypothetical protein
MGSKKGESVGGCGPVRGPGASLEGTLGLEWDFHWSADKLSSVRGGEGVYQCERIG